MPLTIKVLMKALQADCVDQCNSYQMQEVIGCSKGGLIIKIHTAVDALGNPVRFMLSPGQGPDCTQALLLLEEFTTQVVIADKAMTLTKS